jgi:hypothetical protein
LLRLRGEFDVCCGVEPTIAVASFREAIAFAQQQAARTWELKATESLTRLLSSQGGHGEPRRGPFHITLA